MSSASSDPGNAVFHIRRLSGMPAERSAAVQIMKDRHV
ncbi:hypothetical protein GMO_26690 [Gluconobacter morbifer G707]|uniref:Uncharacterized protein n=1 Tax=Gluconobacter morbifer G707 TaxID=1088869 RepID=G6XMF1_9PROT|nr:hypothetical protein GMO_26690 [Gluconobacter morbifer G707]